MAHLLVHSGESPVRYDLPSSTPTTVGRGAASDLFVNDLSCSRLHFRVRPVGDSYCLEECGSASGTRVNGEHVEKRVMLAHGDRIEAGECAFTFSDDVLPAPDGGEPDLAAPPKGTKEFERTLIDGSLGTVVPRADLGPDTIPLRVESVLGRDYTCQICIDNPVVSRRHAILRPEGDGWTIRDLHSANGTFVNHVEIQGKVRLQPGDHLLVGPFSYVYRGDRLDRGVAESTFRLEARGLTKTVFSRTTGSSLDLLKDIRFAIRPNEFVALLGPAGSGKTTLFDALNGRRAPSAGQVLLDGEDLYRNFDQFKMSIGYVPQKDIVHAALPVDRALAYASRLRLPPDTSDREIQTLIQEKLQELGMTDRARERVGALSGGQVKKVNLAIELLADPKMLFADEVTSGLDPGWERETMLLLRRLADRGGRSIVVVTHSMASLGHCHYVIFLVKGRLAYCGPERDVVAHFAPHLKTDLHDLADLYRSLDPPPGGMPGEEWGELWAQRYRESPHHAKYIEERCGRVSTVPEAEAVAVDSSPPPPAPFVGQFVTLVQRNLDALLGERWIKWVYAALPLALGLCVGSMELYDPPMPEMKPQQDKLTVFIAVISACLLGLFSGAVEIAKETTIFRREHAVNLRADAYLASKLAAFGLVGVIQVIAVVWIGLALIAHDNVHMDHRGAFVAALILTHFSSLCFGLLISAWSETPVIAVLILLVVLMPQLVFGGALLPLREWKEALGWPVIAYWGFSAATYGLQQSERLWEFKGQALSFGMLALQAALLTFATWISLRRRNADK